jgi:hypothetical protein
MRTSARHMGCSAAAFVAVAFTAAIAIPPASAQAANVQAQIDCFGVAPQRLTPDATSGKTLRSSARRGTKGWIALHRPDGEIVYIKLDQIVFVMSAKVTGKQPIFENPPLPKQLKLDRQSPRLGSARRYSTDHPSQNRRRVHPKICNLTPRSR